jgi:type II secretory pathway pseudopilin PulG
MVTEMVVEMLVAIIIIAIILTSGGTRIFVRRRYGIGEHFKSIDDAVKRQQLQQRKLHQNVQAK